jgi:hypothetical protein
MNVLEMAEDLKRLGLPPETEIVADSDDCAGRISGYRIVTNMRTGEIMMALMADREAIDVEDHPAFEGE